MWGWVSEILRGLAFILKALFGLDRPEETEVKREESPGLRRPDADYLRELGVRAEPRPAGENALRDRGAGKTGGDPPAGKTERATNGR